MARWSGIGRCTTGLASALAHRSDIAPVLACHRADAGLLGDDVNAEVFSAEHAPFSLAGMRELGSIARSAGVDVTHCLHFPTPLPTPHPLVVTVHDLIPLVVEGVMPSTPRRALYRAVVGRAVRVADALIADSAHTASDLARVFPTHGSGSTVVPLGVDDFAGGEVPPLPSAYADAPFIFAIGSTRPHKGLPVLLHAFAMIATAAPALRLVLAGVEPPGYLDELLPGLADHVRARISFTGPVDDPALRALYANARFFVSPSLYEGFGLPPLEAMAFGTPVISTSAASLPEVVGDAAMLVPAGDVEALASAMHELLSGGDALLLRLAEAGRARAAVMTWERTAEETVAVYRRVLEGVVR